MGAVGMTPDERAPIIVEISDERARDLLIGKQTLFVGAISFEERCTAAVRQLGMWNCLPAHAVLLDYPTHAEPEAEDESLRSGNANLLLRLLSDERVTRERIHPYSPRGFLKLIDGALDASDVSTVVIDVSCLTRAHVIALGTWRARRPMRPQVVYAYTIPLNYQLPSTRRSWGWDDMISLPIGSAPSMSREGHARGILLPGHEPDRVSYALSALEPAAGVIILAETRGRPDFRTTSEQQHSHIFDRLERMRMPGRQNDRWRRVTLGVDDFRALRAAISHEISMAEVDSAPLVFYPFGPKSLVLGVALQLAEEYGGRSWAIYPVPASYDVNYTRGSSRSRWMV